MIQSLGPLNMTTKKCKMCNEEKSIEAFTLKDRKRRPGLYRAECTECRKAWRRKERAENREKYIDEYHERLDKIRSDPILDQERLKKHREYYARNRNRILNNSKRHRRTKRAMEQSRQTRRNRMENDLGFRMKVNIGNRIRMAIKLKSDSTMNLLGCTMEEFLRHLESQFLPGMNWENWGKGTGKWNIDHIEPCCSFDLTNPEQQQKCFHYTNCRPLWEIDNIRKGQLEDRKRSLRFLETKSPTV
jgi:hypothetical protein